MGIKIPHTSADAISSPREIQLIEREKYDFTISEKYIWHFGGGGWRPLLMKRWRTFLCQLHQHLGAFYQDTGTISIVYNFCQNIFIKIPTPCITCRHCLLGNERYIIWHCHLNIYKVVCNSELFVEMSWKTVLTFQTWCMDIMICHYCLLYTS